MNALPHGPGRETASHSTDGFSRAFARAVFFHFAFFSVFWIQGLMFPSSQFVIPPSLRVDLVGLPDLTKAQMADLTPAPPKESEVEQPKTVAPKVVAPPKEVAAPNEMVLNAQKKAEADARERKKRMDAALRRTQALASISQSTAIKGNQISKGSSISSDAKFSGESDYYGNALDHLRVRWSLPIWLKRQELSAVADVWIGANGKLLRHRLKKSSGNEQFDQAVEQTILDSSPFPPPPAALASQLENYGIEVRFPL